MTQKKVDQSVAILAFNTLHASLITARRTYADTMFEVDQNRNRLKGLQTKAREEHAFIQKIVEAETVHSDGLNLCGESINLKYYRNGSDEPDLSVCGFALEKGCCPNAEGHYRGSR